MSKYLNKKITFAGETFDSKKELRRYHELMLPEIARKAVKRIGWQNICLSEEISIERANFRQIYEAITEREKRMAQLPESVKGGLIEKNNDRDSLPG